jgi:hypothetical protein
MGKWIIARLVGGMIILVVTATGYALDVSEVTNIGAKWWPLITLIVGIFLVGWVVFDLQRRINILLGSRPTIHIEIVKEHHTYYLKVHNEGEKGAWQLPFYNGHWRLANNSEAQIMKDQSDMIKVAESIMSSKGFAHLRIFFHDESAKSERYIDTSSHWIGAYVEDENGNKEPLTKWEYKLHVTVSSSPSLREGTYDSYYKLNVDRLEVDTTPLLACRNECS